MRSYRDLNEVQHGLLAQNRIDLVGNVDGSMADYVREALVRQSIKPGHPPILIHITSGGGSVGAGLDIYDMIKMYPGRKVGIVESFAYSMAAIILQACDVRLCTPSTSLLIHHIIKNEVKFDVFHDKKQLTKLVKEMEDSQKELYQILKERTRHSITKIVKVCKEDRPMSAQEALGFGLIDKIVSTADELNRLIEQNTAK